MPHTAANVYLNEYKTEDENEGLHDLDYIDNLTRKKLRYGRIVGTLPARSPLQLRQIQAGPRAYVYPRRPA